MELCYLLGRWLSLDKSGAPCHWADVQVCECEGLRLRLMRKSWRDRLSQGSKTLLTQAEWGFRLSGEMYEFELASDAQRRLSLCRLPQCMGSCCDIPALNLFNQ